MLAQQGRSMNPELGNILNFSGVLSADIGSLAQSHQNYVKSMSGKMSSLREGELGIISSYRVPAKTAI